MSSRSSRPTQQSPLETPHGHPPPKDCLPILYMFLNPAKLTIQTSITLSKNKSVLMNRSGIVSPKMHCCLKGPEANWEVSLSCPSQGERSMLNPQCVCIKHGRRDTHLGKRPGEMLHLYTALRRPPSFANPREIFPFHCTAQWLSRPGLEGREADSILLWEECEGHIADRRVGQIIITAQSFHRGISTSV